MENVAMWLWCLLFLSLPVDVVGGVAGLMAIAKSRLQSGSVADLFTGRVLGVDLSVWLYQVAHLLASDQSLENMTAVAGILVRRAQRLIEVGVGVLICADCRLASPAKAAKRAERRAAKMRESTAAVCGDESAGVEDGDTVEPRAAAAASTGASTGAASGPLDVHGAFQTLVLKLMAMAGIACVIAPFEADHELAHLCLIGTIDAVVSVDSDMLVLGAKQLVLTLLRDGTCTFLTLADLSRPLVAPSPHSVDPMAWLCEARNLGGEA